MFFFFQEEAGIGVAKGMGFRSLVFPSGRGSGWQIIAVGPSRLFHRVWSGLFSAVNLEEARVGEGVKIRWVPDS